MSINNTSFVCFIGTATALTAGEYTFSYFLGITGSGPLCYNTSGVVLGAPAVAWALAGTTNVRYGIRGTDLCKCGSTAVPARLGSASETVYLDAGDTLEIQVFSDPTAGFITPS